MPPEMKRQNAFSGSEPAPFKPIACRICYQNEPCGEWQRITCQCSILNDYYHAHEFCLQRTKKCKVCATPFIFQLPPQPITLKEKYHYYAGRAKEMIIQHKKSVTKAALGVLVILLIYDYISCTTIKTHIVDTDDDDDGSIYLPETDIKCIKQGVINSYILNFYTLVSVALFIYHVFIQ